MRRFLLFTGLGISLPALLLLAVLGYTLRPALGDWLYPSTITAAVVSAPLAAPSGNLIVTVGTDNCPNDRDTLQVRAGTVVYYCYGIENTGDIPLVRHTLTDTLWTEPLLPNDFTSQLNPGSRLSLERILSRTVTSTIQGQALWRGAALSQTFTITDVALTLVEVVTPTITVDLTVGRNATGCGGSNAVTVPINTPVYYCLTLSNTGSTTFTSHSFAAPSINVSAELPLFVIAPGQAVQFTDQLLRELGLSPFLNQAAVQQSATTVFTVTSYTDERQSGFAVAASDAVAVTIGETAIEVNKSVELDPATCLNRTTIIVSKDQPVYYCLRLRNTGLVTLTTHTFADTIASVRGAFTYTLPPGGQVQLTAATLASTPGLTFIERPSLGPFVQEVTTTTTLDFVSRNRQGFRATAAPSTEIRVPASPLELTIGVWTNPNFCAIPQQAANPPVNSRIWYCVRVRNNSSTPLTNHRLVQLIAPPNRAGARYAYTASVQFTYTIQPNQTIFITNSFLTSTTFRLPPVMGPYTVVTPLTDTLIYTNTMFFTSTNRSAGFQVSSRAIATTYFLPATATPSSTPTLSPTPTNPVAATPTPTPVFVGPTNTATETATPIVLSQLATAAPTPQLLVTGVSAPAPQAVALAAEATPTPLPTPSFTPDLATLYATQTAEAGLTATALATLFTPTPTLTETPAPTATPTDTPMPTSTPTATATQRPLATPTMIATADTTQFLARMLDTTIIATGWIWFGLGSLVFFITAGIVAGFSFRTQDRSRYRLSAADQAAPANPAPSTPPQSASPSQPSEDDHWPASLP